MISLRVCLTASVKVFNQLELISHSNSTPASMYCLIYLSSASLDSFSAKSATSSTHEQLSRSFISLSAERVCETISLQSLNNVWRWRRREMLASKRLSNTSRRESSSSEIWTRAGGRSWSMLWDRPASLSFHWSTIFSLNDCYLYVGEIVEANG